VDAVEDFSAASAKSPGRVRPKEMLGGGVKILDHHVLVHNESRQRDAIEDSPRVLKPKFISFLAVHKVRFSLV
jgi:hypothetical protein